jgi:hypothetical protein
MGMQRAGHQQCNKEVVSHVDGGKKWTKKMSLLLSHKPSDKFTTSPSINNIRFSLAHFIYVSRMNTTMNTDYLPTQHLPTLL